MSTCFLCDHPADTKSHDLENRILVFCPNPKCGNYEISRRAIAQLNTYPNRRVTLRDFVNNQSDQNVLVEIFVDKGSNQMAARIK
jgi:hypothetical protein